MSNLCHVLSSKVEIRKNENSTLYLQRLYPIFTNDFINNHPTFKGKNVYYNTHPITHGYEEAFFHMTHVDIDKKGFENRVFDYARSECIHWISQIIKAYPCSGNTCTGIKVWKVKKRIHFLCEKERFMIVIEERQSYYMFISSFILNFHRSLQEKLNQYEKYKDYPI